jgi:hypothetical protein
LSESAVPLASQSVKLTATSGLSASSVDLGKGTSAIGPDRVLAQVDRGDGGVGLERVCQRHCTRVTDIVAAQIDAVLTNSLFI